MTSQPALCRVLGPKLLSAAVLAALASSASAQQILEIYGDSLTSYQPAGATRVQDVRPLFNQRGVNIDGSGRAPAVLGWSINGNPFDGGVGGGRLGELDLVTGNVSPTWIDLSLASKGPPVVFGRSYNQVQDDGGHRNSNGYQGKNFAQFIQVELAFFDNDSDAGTREHEDLVYIVYGADRYIEFKRTDDDTDIFKGKNGAAGIIKDNGGSPKTYTYYDQRGNQIVFFGGSATSGGGDASWQWWKTIDPAGNTAFVGDATTASTAISSGYDSAGRILKVYDASDRRYTCTYNAIDGVTRLTRVEAETKTGGTWASSPTGVATVGQVDYDYYTNASQTYGPPGHLKLVTLTTPLSSGSRVLKQHFRYYTDVYQNSDNRRGGIGMLMMVVGFEGYRAYDWAQDSSLDDDPLTASTDSLKPYADAFFEYPSGSDWKVSKAFFNGECGCGGGANGAYTITYTEKPTDYAANIGDTTYQAAPVFRVVIDQPDSAYQVRYFDETGQPLSHVLTDGNPAVSFSEFIATEVVRTSGGIATTIKRPLSIVGYNHGSWSFTELTTSQAATSTMAATVESSGDLTNFITGRQETSVVGAAAGFVGFSTFTTQGLEVASGVDVERPMVTARRAFHTATTSSGDSSKYNETGYSYTYHSATATSPLFLAVKQITMTAPTVSTANNGSNSATITRQYFRTDGTLALTESASGVFNYTAIDSFGQIKNRIGDVITNGAAFESGDDPNGTWGISENGNGLHYVTEYTYDAQGRSDTTTGPDGLVSKMFYIGRVDGQVVTLSIPRVVAGGSTTYYGPVGYTVTNHAGRVTFRGTIAIADAGTTDALANWIDEADADPITAVDTGTLVRMSTTLYSGAGHQVTESRAYHTIPASGVGSSGANYDRTLFGYDNMGRQRRSKDATGTIHRTVFDWAGRGTETWIGTNDSSFSGGESSGTDNMTKIATRAYDVMSRVTSASTDPDGDWSNPNNDARTTTYTYNGRGFLILTVNALAPHTLSKYDNLGRVVASGQYSSAGGLGASSDPTEATSGSRVSLGETFYDERGMVYKTTRWEIDQGNGDKVSSLDSNTWYDADGRAVKVKGSQLTKTIYDRIGRATNQFVLANDDDSGYADVGDVSGDVVVEQSITVYDNEDKTGSVVLRASVSRHSNDIGAGHTTGVLDTNGDGNDYKLTASNLKGRAQITAMWYDSLRRVTETVSYGTYNGSDFDRRPSGSWLTVPARSDTALRTTTTYDTDGTVKEVTDPRALVTRFEYDQLGRQVTVISNYVNGTPGDGAGDDDQIIRYEYTNGLRTKYIADLPGGGDDQETIYTYGTTKGTPGSGDPVQSAVATGHLLLKVAYPDSASASDVVRYAYNALGQVVWTKDQIGNVLETEYDELGREIHEKATTIITPDTDDAIRRRSTVYLSRGFVDSITQYDQATPGSGAAKDQVRYSYDGRGSLTKFEQDVDSAIGGGGRGAFDVQYTYAANTSGRVAVRRATQVLPGGFTVTFNYSGSGGSLADDLSRVSSMTYNASTQVGYEYAGLGWVVRTDLFEPDAYTQLITPPGSVTNPPTAPAYTNVDRFSRVTSSRWVNTHDVDFYRVDLAYDRNSNITEATDAILTAGQQSLKRWDVLYSMDNLNRLTRAEEGTLGGGSISSMGRDERWALSLAGNFANTKRDLDGSGTFTGAGEFDDDRTFNKANELLTRSDPSSTQTHNPRGEMIDDGVDYKYVYDAWGRLVKVKKRSNDALVAEYRYNGLGYRIGWHYDVTDDGTTNLPDGVVDGDDPWYYFCYDERWRIVATFRGSDANPKERFVWHSAGMDGMGGSSYIDAAVLADRDLTNGWAGAADGTLEKRVYMCQNWRADVSVVLNDNGAILERVKYSAYGVPFCISGADYNASGTVTGADATDFDADYNATDSRADVNFDGSVDFFDYLDFLGEYDGGAGETGGWGVLSRTGVGNRVGYAGYKWDEAIRGTTGGKWHVRHRVLDSGLGVWLRRDPLGYIDGISLYEYLQLRPVVIADPMGLCTPGPCFGQCKALQAAYLTYATAVAGCIACVFLPPPFDILCMGACVLALAAARASIQAACVALQNCEFTAALPLTNCDNDGVWPPGYVPPAPPPPPPPRLPPQYPWREPKFGISAPDAGLPSSGQGGGAGAF